MAIKSVQRGQSTINANPLPTNITISAVDLNKAFITQMNPSLFYQDPTYAGRKNFVAGYLSSSINIAVTNRTPESGTLFWEVTEYE